MSGIDGLLSRITPKKHTGNQGYQERAVRELGNLLISLTDRNILGWHHASHATAVYAEPSVDPGTLQDPVERRFLLELRGIRFGYDQRSFCWTYCRLTDAAGRYFYIESGAPECLIEMAERLFLRISRSLRGPCPHCCDEKIFRRIETNPYGMVEAVFAGSERYQCLGCQEFVIYSDDIELGSYRPAWLLPESQFATGG